MKATLIKATGEAKKVSPKNGKDFKLKEMQKYVGGPIEMLTTLSGEYMVVNETGRIDNLPYNEKATEIWGDHIFGDVVVCDKKMVK